MSAEKIVLNGLNNRLRDEALPAGKARNAVNVQFDNDSNIIMPRAGKTLRYSGDVHSVYQLPFITLFVENGNLKRLNDDNTVTILTTVGNNPVAYCTVGDIVFYSSGPVIGKIVNGLASEWGTERPSRQPDLTAVATGDLFAGTYRVAITWVADEESGTDNSVSIDVDEGGGIRVTNFPVPPNYVKYVAVYASNINSKYLYLYGEYRPDINEITITKNISVIPLTTQFAYRPAPTDIITAHYGRIYYARNRYLYFTEAHRYGLQRPNNYWTFDSDIQLVASTPGVLYVGTEKSLSKITNIDGEEAPIFEKLQDCAGVKGSVTYDPDGISAYFMSNRGFIKATPEGLQELSYDQVAIPYFKTGTMTVIEMDGLKYLVGAFQNGTQNTLGNADYNASELARNSL